MKKTILSGTSTYDGAGVKLTRIFAHDHTKLTDPFLLLDHFGSDNPDDYIKGFPWHPHRGIETVTYMFGGVVEHGDSMGNSGKIAQGDIQWMTAGSGIIHQEMPKASKGMMHGLQLWVNLPAKNKMMPPRYRGIVEKDVPLLKIPGGEIRIIAGTYNKIIGPVRDLVVDVEYLDVSLTKGSAMVHKPKKDYTSFCYVVEGMVEFDGEKVEHPRLILFTAAEKITVKALEKTRYIYVSGEPLKEPIAWGGPIVMNTNEELELAFQELNEGKFVKQTAK